MITLISEPHILPYNFLVDVLTSVCELSDCARDHLEELLFPYSVEFIYLLVSLSAVCHEIVVRILRSLLIFLGLKSSGLCSSVSVLFALFLIRSFLYHFLKQNMSKSKIWKRRKLSYRRKKIRCWKNLVKMLELLSCLHSIIVSHAHSIYFNHIWESVDYKCPH